MSRTKLPDKNFKWTPELAYVVGLLVTDGCLSSDGRHIIMKSSDLQLLRTFKKCLSLSNGIKQTFNNGWATRPAYRLQFGNVQLYRWLLKIGLTPRKTYTIEKIKIPNKFFRDFIMGHIDGDGSIWSYKDYYNTYKNPKYIYKRLWVRLMSASEKHMIWWRKKVTERLNVSGHFSERKPWRDDQTTSTWNLKFGKKESIKLLSQIYYNSDVPCLLRKRKIADKFI